MLIDPDKTMTWTDGKLAPVGKDSSLKTWKGDQWKIGGGTTWGWYSYDKALNLVYYGTGNPSTWNPAQRPGDNKWSMTIFARDVDTGMAKWVYQMTPYDEWDFDGVNEMILADINVKGKPTKALVHFDRNGFGYTLDRTTGALLVAEKYDPAVNWATNVDMKTGRPQVVAKYSHGAERSRRQHQGHLPGGARHQGPAAGGVRSEDQAVLRADQPRLHGLRAVQGRVHGGPAVRGRDAVDVPGAGQHGGMGNFIAWDAGTGKIVQSKPEKFSVWSGALDDRRRRRRATARSRAI